MPLELPTGHIIRMRPNGERTLFGADAADSDTARGSELFAAIDASQPEDSLLLGPGVYDADGSAFVPKEYTSVIASGSFKTYLVTDDPGTGQGADAAAIRIENDGIELSHLFARHLLPVDGSQLGAGILVPNGTISLKDVVLNNVRTYGRGDGFLFRTSSIDGDTHLLFYNCIFEAAFDGFAAWQNSNSGTIIVEMFNCICRGIGESGGPNTTRGVLASEDNLVLHAYNCLFEAIAHGNTNHLAGVHVDRNNPDLNFWGGRIKLEGVGSTTTRDINLNEFGGICTIQGLAYNPTLVNPSSDFDPGGEVVIPTVMEPRLVTDDPLSSNPAARPPSSSHEVVRYDGSAGGDSGLYWCVSPSLTEPEWRRLD